MGWLDFERTKFQSQPFFTNLIFANDISIDAILFFHKSETIFYFLGEFRQHFNEKKKLQRILNRMKHTDSF